MLRVVNITVSPPHTDEMLAQVRHLPGLVGLQVQRAVSLQPVGDVVTVQVTNRGLAPLMQLLREPGMASGFSTTEPASFVSKQIGP